MYLDANNLYGWAMIKKLPVGKFEWIHPNDYTEDLIKSCDDNDDYGAILEVDIEYPKELLNKHKDLAFLPERRKINKTNKLITCIEDKEKYVVHISALKQALNHGLVLKKVHRVIQFYQEVWMKTYIDMNTKLRMEAMNDYKKDFVKLVNNAVFGKTSENVRNHRDIKIVTTNKQRNKYASEPNYHTTKRISENLLIMEMKKTEVKMNKPVYLGQEILNISKTLMYQFWYDYIKLKYGGKARLCYMDTDSFIIYIETEDFYEDIAGDVEKWFDTSNYDKNDERRLPIEINGKILDKFKDEPGGKIMAKNAALRAKVYAYLKEDGGVHKRAKGTKKCAIKREIMFENYRESLFEGKIISISQQRFRSDHHNVYTKEVNKTALSSNDAKRLQTSDRITTYPYG